MMNLARSLGVETLAAAQKESAGLIAVVFKTGQNVGATPPLNHPPRSGFPNSLDNDFI